MNTGTPRTDAAAIAGGDTIINLRYCSMTLEEELAVMTADNERLRDERDKNGRSIDHARAIAEELIAFVPKEMRESAAMRVAAVPAPDTTLATLRAELAEAKAEAEHQKLYADAFEAAERTAKAQWIAAQAREAALRVALEKAHPAEIWDKARMYYTHETSFKGPNPILQWHADLCKAVDAALASDGKGGAA
jgi:asparagine synthetase B (glutamine-hydrolysing)